MLCLFLLILLGLAAPAWAQIPAAPLEQRFQIRGRVVNAITGQALSKVEVAIGPVEGQKAARSALSGEDGGFDFKNLPRGKYWIAAGGRGFDAQRLDQHEEFSTAVAVGPNVDSEELIFRLRPAASIVGDVIDEQNEPVRDAQVMLVRTGLHNGATSARLISQTSTDDRGRYHFSHVAQGTYYVAVSAQPWYAEAGATSVGWSPTTSA